jgi:hypothetical protein
MFEKIKRTVGFGRQVALAAATVTCLGTLGAHSAARGAVSLSDNAANAAYTNNVWATGTNGGTGFSPWYLTPDISQSGVNQSATWGFDTESASNIFGTTASPNINTNGVAWALWSQNATGTDPVAQTAYREFNYALVPGATFTIDMATDAMGTQGAEGFQLQSYNSSTGYATPILEVAAFATGTDYSVSWGGYSSSSQGFTNSQSSTISTVHDGTTSGNNGNGIQVAVTIGSADTASVTLTPLNTALQPDTFSSITLNNLPINQIALFNDNLGSSYQADYFNNINISDPVSAPEPPSLVILAGLLAFPLVLRSRHRSRCRSIANGGA